MHRMPSTTMQKELDESGMQQELHFLNTTGPSKLDGDARLTIRTQSLKHYHKKRKVQRALGTDGTRVSLLHGPRVSGGRVQRFRLVSDGLKPTETQPQPAYTRRPDPREPDGPGSVDQESGEYPPGKKGRSNNENGRAVLVQADAAIIGLEFDPFDALPLPSTPRIKHLVKQVMVRINSNSPTRDYRRYWFKHASQDVACFYIALCQSAADADLTLQRGRTVEAISYQNKALQIINRRLADPAWKVDNTTIGGVAALASFEISNGSLAAARTHLLGMEKMICIKGESGDPAIPDSLRRVVLWVNLVAANYDISVPNIHMLLQKITDGESTSFDDLEGPSTSLASAAELIAEIDCDLRMLTAAKSARRFASATPEEEVQFGEKAYMTQKRLMELTGTLDASAPDTWTLGTIWALAASMYSSIILFETSMTSVIVETLVLRIQKTMEAVIERDGLTAVARAVKADDKLFWALVLGGIASENTPHREWFVRSLKMICHLLDPWFQRALRARDALTSGALWDSNLNGSAGRLWAEVDLGDSRRGNVLDFFQDE